jgi:hypothetical protein
LGGTEGGAAVSVTTVLAHSRVSDVLELDTVSELIGLLCKAGGVDGGSVTNVLDQSMSPKPSPTSSVSGSGSWGLEVAALWITVLGADEDLPLSELIERNALSFLLDPEMGDGGVCVGD